MVRWAMGVFISLIGFTASAQSIALTGTISNKSNKPISEAIVKLVNQNIADTTNAQGSYSFLKSSFVAPPAQIVQSTEKMSFANGFVVLNLTKTSPVRIEMFDMKGNLLEKLFDQPVSAGDYRFGVMGHPLAATMILIRVSIGPRSSTFRYLLFGNGKNTVFSSRALSSSGSMRLARTQAAVDTLKVSASGYLSTDSAISSYQGAVNVALDTTGLAKFSFFITSLKVLVELSKSTNGFGGDFSFGKTGQGAGILGADSICQCIAEKSMPGSRIKIWRAFLSAAKGPNGQQVNAIERIGQGPWYDRLGRIVSPDIKGLLNPRPNADPAIKNDLPNEDGIPNHQPDPNKPANDNHHMVTGTDTSGHLYKAEATCNDWTSKSTSLKGPYGGLSWPRAGGGGGGIGLGTSHWMSGMTLCGCRDSISIIESGGPPRNCNWIGGGGGYGGFYCFALNP